MFVGGIYSQLMENKSGRCLLTLLHALGVSEKTSKLITMPSPEKAIAKEGTTRGAKINNPTVKTLFVDNGVYLIAS